MDKLVKSITVIRRVGGETEAVRIYQDPKKKKRRKVSGWDQPFERAARKLLKANTAFSEGALRRTNTPSPIEGVHVVVEPVQTVMRGPVLDQAALHGIINRLQRLGLDLIEVRRLTDQDIA